MRTNKQDAEVKQAMESGSGYTGIRRPRMKEYTLIKYVDKKEVSREKVWVDESKIFPTGGNILEDLDVSRAKKKIA